MGLTVLYLGKPQKRLSELAEPVMKPSSAGSGSNEPSVRVGTVMGTPETSKPKPSGSDVNAGSGLDRGPVRMQWEEGERVPGAFPEDEEDFVGFIVYLPEADC